MTFQPLIPAPGDYLATSQLDIQQNFQVSNTAFGKDHVAFDTVPNQGKHQRATILTGGLGVTLAGEGMLNVINSGGAREQLYYFRENNIAAKNIPISMIGGFANVTGAGAVTGTAFNLTCAGHVAGSGKYTMTFGATANMMDEHYVIVATADTITGVVRFMTVITKTAANFTLECKGLDDLFHDPDTFSVIVMGEIV